MKLRGFNRKRTVSKEPSPLPLSLAKGEATHRRRCTNSFVRNLFARQSRFHLIKLLETTALHAYATTI